ncbi:unnamed protein product [Caenorhabditis sp. 36 PRJEB53466]|nr:unnamed protein product [Caenorhabditis sp. 36 PRJEB53466]
MKACRGEAVIWTDSPAMNAAFLIFLMIYRVNSQYEPQSNIDRLAQRPVLPQCPREWEWACRNGECIAHYDVCDGITQCTDGSDEWNCDSARGAAPLAREGIAPPREKEASATVAAVQTTTAAAANRSGTVTIQYSHILIALLAFVALSVAVVAVIRRSARQKTGFRNRRGHNILQQDSDEDDILISSMYS